MSWTILEKSVYIFNGCHKVSYVLRRSEYGHHHGMTHTKTVFSLSLGNALCSADDSVTQLIHILHFLMINSIFYKPPEEKIHSHIWRLRGPLVPFQWSGNFLSWKAWIWGEKSDGASTKWKLLLQWHANHCPDNWIGRGRSIPWPSCSPDWTPLDYLCSGL